VDIAAWLQSLGMQQYEEAFRDNAIDAAVLPELTADDLKDLGVNLVGHRRRLLVRLPRCAATIVLQFRPTKPHLPQLPSAGS
jgi:hypothetical protein